MILFFTFGELIKIIFELILSLQSELLLFYKKTAKNTILVIFYKDNIFRIFEIYQKQYIFLYNHFFCI